MARIFQSLGATILDADDIAHRLIEKGSPAYGHIVEAFGSKILRDDGSIDRRLLGQVVFSDTGQRSLLESILHPRIREEEATLVATLTSIGQGRIAVTNAALLIETGAYRDYHRVVVVYCAPEAQLDRIVARDDLTREEARARIAAQMPTGEKLKLGHYAIDTTSGFAGTETLARDVFRHLQLDLQALSELH